MTIDDELLVAIRAYAGSRSSIFPGRRRFSTDDAGFADGRVARAVDADAVLQGGRLPADAWATKEAAEHARAELRQGDWVEYPMGRRIAESAEPEKTHLNAAIRIRCVCLSTVLVAAVRRGLHRDAARQA